MKLLVDSHVFIWMLYQPEKLGHVATATIFEADEVFVSVVSLWELAIKHEKGKFKPSPNQLARGVDALNLQLLPLATKHIVHLHKISVANNDPFDKMIVTQSQADGLTLLTADKVLLKTKYRVLDARL